MLSSKRVLVILILSMVCLSLFAQQQSPTGINWMLWSEEEKVMFVYGFQIGILVCLDVLEEEGRLVGNILARTSRYKTDPEVLVRIIDYYYGLTRGYQQHIEAILYNLESWLDEKTFHRFEEEYNDSESIGSESSD